MPEGWLHTNVCKTDEVEGRIIYKACHSNNVTQPACTPPPFPLMSIFMIGNFHPNVFDPNLFASHLLVSDKLRI